MHTAICGMSGSGKSHAASHLALASLKAGFPVFYYDPIGNDFPCSWRTNDPDKLLRAAMETRNASIFVDEAPGILTNEAKRRPLQWLATQSRHRGHECFFLAQDITKMDTVYRRQCSRLYLFKVLPSSAKLWAEEFGDMRLMEVARDEFPQHVCLFKKHWGANGLSHVPERVRFPKEFARK